MTNPNPEMPEDPGAPENTDEEAVTPQEAEAAASIDEELSDIEAAVAEDEGESDVEKQLAERTEDLQRVSAEYANYRRRTERERGQIAEHAKAKFAGELLPLLDDLDLAEQHGDLKEGPLKAFADKLRSVLAVQKVAAFGAEGEAFNPEIHEAVQDLSSGGEQVIGSVLRKGYAVGDKLIRNAMVIIADPAESAEADDEA
ncbi:heat shock protein GrpE [Corynebacterium imitans]|uniref:Protein GrpE n=1 Tax=Corynebacterium imitans TaxID=156978 RepID=A0A076NTP1_9CORY|nr:nucleotide exchange factor GrpE [Corynebacterium imitans]AIJ34287.1 heat shock protein GrpE [Corynebacterium imitans]SNV84240.1 heat shock protein GrpE [Corynebacterium imitans]